MPSLALVPLVAWSGGVSVLALIDAYHLVLPTPIVRVAILGTGALLATTNILSGVPHDLLCAVGAMAAAGTIYGAWSLIRPCALGFGDVRMACLIALGAGACSPSAAMVALSCAPFAAGVGGKFRATRTKPPQVVPTGPGCQPVTIVTGGGGATGERGPQGTRTVPMPLGPLLALAGITGVVASAV